MKKSLAAFVGLLVTCAASAIAQTVPAEKNRLPHNLDQQLKQQTKGKTPVIKYHGGPVVSASTDLYVVYYGSFTSTQHNILDTFLQNLGGSPAFNINTEYYDSHNQHVQNILNYNPARFLQ